MWSRFWSVPRSATPRRGPRVLLYSHDTYGLGHLRRSRAISIALAEAFPNASILIMTGSPIVGRFDFPSGVDFVRVPGVVKLPSGDYATHNMNIDISATTALRQQMIEATAKSFEPDLLIVDKEAAGLRGEMVPTLETLRRRGCRIVLGLRDVLDEPEALAKEWARKKAIEIATSYYDEFWIYGLRDIYDPLQGLKIPKSMASRIRYTGYLRREPTDWPDPAVEPPDKAPFILVTAGGGGDGEWLMDWTLSAYEADPSLQTRAHLVFGPFMNAEARREFERRAAELPMIEATSFDSRLERLMLEADGVIAMGGYNTFCEVLSFDKPAVIAPRTSPRLEQYIRAEAAEKLGLVRMLPGLGVDVDASKRDPAVMAEAIRGLATQRKPSAANTPGLLAGLEAVVEYAAPTLGRLQAAE